MKMSTKDLSFSARVGIMAATILTPSTLFVFGIRYFETGYLSPIKQERVLNERAQERKQREEKYERLYVQLLNLADKDKNGYVDFAEQVEAWRKMGYTKIFIESKGAEQFPNPALDNLEKAVRVIK